MLTTLLTGIAKRGLKALSPNSSSSEFRRHDAAVATNVVPLYPHDARNPEPDAPAEASLPREQPAGLQDEPLLVKYRSRDYFSIGYVDGAHAPNHEDLESGCVRLHAHFCEVVGTLIGVRQAQLDRAALKLLDAGQQGSPLAKDRLGKLTETYQRDIDELERQIKLARGGEGWYWRVCVDYRSGFQRALREALDATTSFR
jgi:hypothetical protein